MIINAWGGGLAVVYWTDLWNYACYIIFSCKNVIEGQGRKKQQNVNLNLNFSIGKVYLYVVKGKSYLLSLK